MSSFFLTWLFLWNPPETLCIVAVDACRETRAPPCRAPSYMDKSYIPLEAEVNSKPNLHTKTNNSGDYLGLFWNEYPKITHKGVSITCKNRQPAFHPNLPKLAMAFAMDIFSDGPSRMAKMMTNKSRQTSGGTSRFTSHLSGRCLLNHDYSWWLNHPSEKNIPQNGYKKQGEN